MVMIDTFDVYYYVRVLYCRNLLLFFFEFRLDFNYENREYY